MKPTTQTILLAAVEGDDTLGPQFRQALLRLVESPDSPPAPDLVNEPEAARLLGLAQSSLNAWRRDASRPFPFRTYPQPGTETGMKTPKHLYDRRQLLDYLQTLAVPPRQL